MFLYRLFFAVCFLSATLGVMAQDIPLEKNEQDNIYTPGKNSIFYGGEGSSSSKSTEIGEIKNAIKFNPSLLVRSMATFLYERNITNGITAQIGLGFCFNKDRVMVAASEADFTFSEYNSSLPLSYMVTNGGFVSGTNFSSSFRFYYSNYYSSYESFNSGYFEIGYRGYSNNLRIPDNVPITYNYYSEYFTTGGIVKIKNNLYHINYGYQFYTQGKVKTTHDFYIGFGIKSTSYNLFKPEDRYIYDPSSGSNQPITIHVKSISRESVIAPSILFGYVFGFGF